MTIVQQFWQKLLSIFRRGADTPDTDAAAVPTPPSPAPEPAPVDPVTVHMSWTHEGAKARPYVQVWPIWYSECRSCVILSQGHTYPPKTVSGGTQKQNAQIDVHFAVLVRDLQYPCVVEINNVKHGMIRFIGIDPAKEANYEVTI